MSNYDNSQTNSSSNDGIFCVEHAPVPIDSLTSVYIEKLLRSHDTTGITFMSKDNYDFIDNPSDNIICIDVDTAYKIILSNNVKAFERVRSCRDIFEEVFMHNMISLKEFLDVQLGLIENSQPSLLKLMLDDKYHISEHYSDFTDLAIEYAASGNFKAVNCVRLLTSSCFSNYMFSEMLLKTLGKHEVFNRIHKYIVDTIDINIVGVYVMLINKLIAKYRTNDVLEVLIVCNVNSRDVYHNFEMITKQIYESFENCTNIIQFKELVDLIEALNSYISGIIPKKFTQLDLIKKIESSLRMTDDASNDSELKSTQNYAKKFVVFHEVTFLSAIHTGNIELIDYITSNYNCKNVVSTNPVLKRLYGKYFMGSEYPADHFYCDIAGSPHRLRVIAELEKKGFEIPEILKAESGETNSTANCTSES